MVMSESVYLTGNDSFMGRGKREAGKGKREPPLSPVPSLPSDGERGAVAANAAAFPLSLSFIPLPSVSP